MSRVITQQIYYKTKTFTVTIKIQILHFFFFLNQKKNLFCRLIELGQKRTSLIQFAESTKVDLYKNLHFIT